MSPTELRKRYERVNVPLSVAVAIENTATDATRVQKEQLFSGIKSDGSPILPPYTPRTIAIKQRKGQPTNRVTLRDTGDYYAGILIDVRQDIFVIESADGKAEKLQDKYGAKILGLARDARIEYIRTLKPEIIRQIKSYLQ